MSPSASTPTLVLFAGVDRRSARDELRQWIIATGSSAARAGPIEVYQLVPAETTGSQSQHSLFGVLGGPARLYARIPLAARPEDLLPVPPDGWHLACVVDTVTVLDRYERLDQAASRQLGLTRRNPSLTKDQFRTHWTTVHAPLAIAAGPLYEVYIQNTVLSNAAPIDGIVDTIYPSRLLAMEHHRRNREERHDSRRDTMRLLDGSERYWVEVYVD